MTVISPILFQLITKEHKTLCKARKQTETVICLILTFEKSFLSALIHRTCKCMWSIWAFGVATFLQHGAIVADFSTELFHHNKQHCHKRNAIKKRQELVTKSWGLAESTGLLNETGRHFTSHPRTSWIKIICAPTGSKAYRFPEQMLKDGCSCMTKTASSQTGVSGIQLCLMLSFTKIFI